MTTFPTPPSGAAGGGGQVPPEIDGAMRTGQGADDDLEMTVGDKHAGEVLPDPDGDGRLSVHEAETLLGGDEPAAEEKTREENG